jgi:hypothetical protein
VKSHLDKRDLLSTMMLAGFCLFLFRDIIIGGHHLGGIDFVQFYLAMKKFLYEEIHLHHSIPFWNPYIFSGMPFWAHFESTIFYPLGFLFWVIPPNTAYDLTMFGHTALASLLMYFMARAFGIGRTGSFVAAAVYGCNGFLMAIIYLGQLSPVMSYIWLPAVLLFLHKAIAFRKPMLYGSIAGLLWGFQIMAGAPQDAFYTFLASSLFLVVHIRPSRKTTGDFFMPILIACLLFVFGAGIAAIQIIPSFELIGQSVRASLDSYDMVTQGSFPPQGIITMALPHFFGDYARAGFWVENTPWSIPHQNLYVGVLPLLALLFVSYSRSEYKKLILFAGIVAATALLLAMGRHTPVYKLIYLLPGFDRFRAPSKIIVLWAFATGLLAGAGVDQILKRPAEGAPWRLWILTIATLCLLILDAAFHYRDSFVLDVFSPFILKEVTPDKMGYAIKVIQGEFHQFTLFVLTGFLITFLLRRKLLSFHAGGLCLCALLLLDLACVYSPTIKPDNVYRTMESIKKGVDQTLGKDKSVYRVGSFMHHLGGNFEMYLGYQTVNGYTALFPSRVYEYCSRFSENRIPEGWETFFYGATKNPLLMDLLNVKYEISYDARNYAQRDTYLPRAFVVPECKTLRKEDVLEYMTKANFDPTKTVLFEDSTDRVSCSGDQAPKQDSSSTTQIISYRPDEMVLKVNSSAPGFLFLSEVFYPGWKAYIDDRPTKIQRGDYLFRVIPLPAGHHQIQMVFDPLTIKLGIGVSVFALLVILGTLVYFFRRRRVPAKR